MSEADTISGLRHNAREELAAALPQLSVDVVALEVDLLLSHVLEVPREYLFSRSEERIKVDLRKTFARMLGRRKNSEPLAYIIGHKEFYSLDFVVTPEVLIPRPETELLVDCALKQLGAVASDFIFVDIGVGSGAVLLSVVDRYLKQLGRDRIVAQDLSGSFIGCDISIDALAISKQNALRFGYEDLVEFYQGDLLQALSNDANRAMANRRTSNWIIVSNPPYIKSTEKLPTDIAEYEPPLALFAGADGLSIISRLIVEAKDFLSDKPSGQLLFEFAEGQDLEIERLSRKAGFKQCLFSEDLSGELRVAILS